MIHRARQLIATVLLTGFGALPAAAQQEPAPLLQQINDAMQQLDYTGTLVRSADGRLHTLHVTHRNRDGVSMEKLVTMDGEQREILRVGNELICLLPQRQLKFVDKTAGASNAFARLPAVAEKIGRYYELVSLGEDRVAGRKARRYFIRPRDAFRYGHGLWVDDETLLPLRMQLLNANRVVEEIRFTDVVIGGEIPDSALTSAIDDSGYQVVHADSAVQQMVGSDALTVGSSVERRGDLPPAVTGTSGFTLRGSQGATVEVNGRKVRRFEYSDGIATVSVFVAAGSSTPLRKQAKLGATHSYQQSMGNATMTLVGEVPMSTLRMLAEQAGQQLSDVDPADAVETE